MKKKIISMLIALVLLVSATALVGCSKEVKTYAVNYQLTCQVEGQTVSVTVDGKSELGTKRLKQGVSLTEAVENLGEVVPQTGYVFVGWVYILGGEEYHFNDSVLVGKAIADGDKITIAPKCSLEPVLTVKFQLDYKFPQYSKYGVRIFNSYTKVNGSKTLPDFTIEEDAKLDLALEGLAEPVEVTKDGKAFPKGEEDFNFVGWYYLVGDVAREITDETIATRDISVNGTITVVAYCEASWVGPF